MFRAAETTSGNITERDEQLRGDQAIRLADLLYPNNPRVVPTRDNSQAGAVDAGSLHIARDDTYKTKGKEDTHPAANPPRHAMNQEKTVDCEHNEAVNREAALHERSVS